MRYKTSHKCSEGNITFAYCLITLIKPNVPLLYLQMMLERRTNQGMLRLIQPKGGGGGSGREKPNVKDKVEKCPVTVNGSGDCDHEGKTQHEKTDETNHVPSPTGVTNPGPVNASTPPAVENPVPTPGLGKLTYNPITHAPSMSDFICTGSTPIEHQYFIGTDQNMFVVQSGKN